MLETFLTVSRQVLILFILMGAGIFCGKKKLIGEVVVQTLTNLVLTLVTPCVIIHSFQRPFDIHMLTGLGIATLAAFGAHLTAIVLAYPLFRRQPDKQRPVLRLSIVFSNAGFMGLPLLQAILGDDGVFYGAAYIAVFNLLMWSYGLIEMSGGKNNLSIVKLILNPGTIGIFIGLPLFFFSVTLPEVVAMPITHLANLNTPIPMLIIGYYLSQTNPFSVVKNKAAIGAVVMRLIIMPLFVLGALALCGVRGPLLIACVISVSAPIAATTTMFSTRYQRDALLSVKLVSFSTLCSILTMPLIVTLATMMAG